MLSRSTVFGSKRSPLGLVLAGTTLAVLLTASRTSFAADDCPPGSWFCGDQQQQPQQAPPAAPAAEPAPAPAAATPAAAGNPPPPVIIYQAPPKSEPPPPYVYTPAEAPIKRTWALGANLQVPLFFGSGNNSGMGGVGGLLRIRPRGGVFALQGEVGSYFGKDYNGDNRAEFATAGNIMLFAMPKKKTSLYFLGGLGFAAAHVNRGYTPTYGGGYNYRPSSSDFGYFGAQTGIGLEVGLGTRVALDFELRGFLRQRIDSAPEPEFVRGNQVTNASAGGLLSMGLTFYF